MPFQPDLPAGNVFSGWVTTEVFSPGLPPTWVLSVNTPWTIRVRWSITGLTVPGLAGTWLVRAFLESIGPGFENQVGPTLNVPVGLAPLVANTRTYQQDIGVAANPAILQGPHKLVVVVTHLSADVPPVPTQYAGYVEGPILQFIP